MHIGSILLSIQSLLCENPLHNEPGFENETGERNDNYNRIVMYDTFHNLILSHGFRTPEEFNIFKNEIMNHLMEKKDTIKNKILRLGVRKIDYIKLLDVNNLIRPYKKNIKYRIFVAYFLRKTRLIDNI